MSDDRKPRDSAFRQLGDSIFAGPLAVSVTPLARWAADAWSEREKILIRARELDRAFPDAGLRPFIASLERGGSSAALQSAIDRVMAGERLT